VDIETVRDLRRQGEHEKARELAARLAAADPHDAELQYEAACVHDFLGFEAEAVPYYCAALAGKLNADDRRGSYTGLGSTYRILGRYQDAEATLLQGLGEFPHANELRVFLAMTLHNLGRSKEAVEALLKLLAQSSQDEGVRSYRRAIAYYAEDVDKAK
jgi:tetratricopeptide (TPR) repeat protein